MPENVFVLHLGFSFRILKTLFHWILASRNLKPICACACSLSLPPRNLFSDRFCETCSYSLDTFRIFFWGIFSEISLRYYWVFFVNYYARLSDVETHILCYSEIFSYHLIYSFPPYFQYLWLNIKLLGLIVSFSLCPLIFHLFIILFYFIFQTF